ncbi:MAG: hypothetical protein J1E97_03370 [Muribaculaceae bacterium]|nr:hypothetical protein [Muribaculaceae bacterium]
MLLRVSASGKVSEEEAELSNGERDVAVLRLNVRVGPERLKWQRFIPTVRAMRAAAPTRIRLMMS